MIMKRWIVMSQSAIFLNICKKSHHQVRRNLPLIQWRSLSTSDVDELKRAKVKDHHVEKTPITVQLWQMRSLEQKEAEDAKPTYELLTKNTTDSRLNVRYNFAADSNLRDLYIDPLGNVIIGKLFEDLDALAGNIANRHCDDNNPLTKRLNLVTASVDKIVQNQPISIQQNLILTGQVIWVGSSSLVISMRVYSEKQHASSGSDEIDLFSSSNNLEPLLSSYFTYVARCRHTGKSVAVNKLKLETTVEEMMSQERQKLIDERKKPKDCTVSNESLTQLIDAGCAIEDMPALANPNAVLMKRTSLENSLLCQPQHVNTSGRVFGGFISKCGSLADTVLVMFHFLFFVDSFSASSL